MKIVTNDDGFAVIRRSKTVAGKPVLETFTTDPDFFPKGYGDPLAADRERNPI